MYQITDEEMNEEMSEEMINELIDKINLFNEKFFSNENLMEYSVAFLNATRELKSFEKQISKVALTTNIIKKKSILTLDTEYLQVIYKVILQYNLKHDKLTDKIEEKADEIINFLNMTDDELNKKIDENPEYEKICEEIGKIINDAIMMSSIFDEIKSSYDKYYKVINIKQKKLIIQYLMNNIQLRINDINVSF
jgi:hypothetical protein